MRAEAVCRKRAIPRRARQEKGEGTANWVRKISQDLSGRWAGRSANLANLTGFCDLFGAILRGARTKENGPAVHCRAVHGELGSAERIRTSDLKVMSLALLLHSQKARGRLLLTSWAVLPSRYSAGLASLVRHVWRDTSALWGESVPHRETTSMAGVAPWRQTDSGQGQVRIQVHWV